MAQIGNYGTGSIFSYRYSIVDDLLNQIADNTSNLIGAQDVRDSVYTLWARIDDVQSLAASAASQSAGILYSNPNSTLINVGGISVSTTFSNRTMQNMWDDLLYPDLAPTASISTESEREFGDLVPLTVTWNVYKTSQTILNPSGGIFINGNPEVSSGNTQVGFTISNSTHSSIITNPLEYQNFTLTVTDIGLKTGVATCSLAWKTKIYWGRTDLSSIGNPNLFLNPGSASLCLPFVSDTQILALSGAGANGMADVPFMGNELNDSKNKQYIGIDGQGQYLVFAWPSIVSGAFTPKFLVNGVESTAFTNLRNNSPFANLYSFTGINYEVWISNTILNSPVDVVIS